MEDDAHWPLATAVYRQAATLEDYRAQLRDWDRWLAHGQAFALLRVYVTPASLLPPEGSAALGKHWLAQNRPLMQRWLLGMATVILPPQNYARMKNMKVEKAFGVPGGVFSSVAEGLDWLEREVFAPRGLKTSVAGLETLGA